MNIVEDSSDQMPPHADEQRAVAALQDFKNLHFLCDGWRKQYPGWREFTYKHKRTISHSRLDHLYVNTKTYDQASEWTIDWQSGVQTDHATVGFRLHNPKMPSIGHGRWTMPLYLIGNKSMQEEAHKLTIELQEKLERMHSGRTETENPQTLYSQYKKDMVSMIR
jgi:hypothetical protein